MSETSGGIPFGRSAEEIRRPAEKVSRPAEGVTEAVEGLTEQTKNLVLRQLRAAVDETVSKAKQNMPAVGLLALSGAFGLCAAASGYRLSLRLLEKWFGPVGGATAALAVYGGGAAAAAVAGVQWLRAAPLPVPTKTMQRATDEVAETNAAGTVRQASDHATSG